MEKTDPGHVMFVGREEEVRRDGGAGRTRGGAGEESVTTMCAVAAGRSIRSVEVEGRRWQDILGRHSIEHRQEPGDSGI